MVSLKEFVLATLTDVTDALIEFEERENVRGRDITPFPELSGKGEDLATLGIISHSVYRYDAQGREIRNTQGYHDYNLHVITPMEFDVAVTASSEDELSGGVGLRVVEMFKAGVDAKETTTSSSVSRVRFKVPIQLPVTRRRA